MALSRQVIISDGTTKQYPITFADGYLSRDEVKVYEEFDDGTPNSDIPFIFINDNLIELSRVPISGNKIVIERDVEANSRMVNFIPQYIKSSDLNTMYKHLLYLIQSVLDGRFDEGIIKDLDMGFNRIYNIGAPKQDNDAVRLIDVKNYTDLAQSLNQQNAAHAAAAKVSETNAKASETAAKASQNAAAASAQSAANTVNGFDAHAADKQQDFDDNYTRKLNSFNSNAANKQAQVDASVETARKWAIGTISEQPNGSAKYWAEQSKTATAGTLNESILTDCLTEIPQDIKLELNNGTLTLKAGSKVYVPNGVGKFDTITITSDKTTTTSINGTWMYFINSSNNLQRWDISSCFSGATAPTSVKYSMWYDTTNNIIKISEDYGSTWSGKFSLPMAVVTVSNGAISSIDQVFNGFGYIGNTTFALPGVKGLLTNGFNTDGSLNSIEETTNTVSLPFNETDIPRTEHYLTNYGVQAATPGTYTYDRERNVYINQSGSVRYICFAYSVTRTSTGRITSLTPKTAFHAVDYSEFTRALETKQDVISLIANRALVSDTSGNIAVSAVTSTELEYLGGVTSAIQTQLNGKALADLSNAAFDGIDSGYVYIGDLLIQWGRVDATSSPSTVTLPKPFASSRNYGVNVTTERDDGAGASVLNVGTTSFTVHTKSGSSYFWIAIGKRG